MSTSRKANMYCTSSSWHKNTLFRIIILIILDEQKFPTQKTSIIFVCSVLDLLDLLSAY